MILLGIFIQSLLIKLDGIWGFTTTRDSSGRIEQKVPIPSRGYYSIKIVEVIFNPLSFPLIRLIGAFELCYILGKTLNYHSLDLIFRDTDKILSFLG